MDHRRIVSGQGAVSGDVARPADILTWLGRLAGILKVRERQNGRVAWPPDIEDMTMLTDRMLADLGMDCGEFCCSLPQARGAPTWRHRD
jgi:hypothetical protein